VNYETLVIKKSVYFSFTPMEVKMPNLRKSSVICFGLAAAVAALPGAALAVPQESWTIAGAACVPTGQTSNDHLVFNSAGDAGFAAGTTGEIILTCPVFSTIELAHALTITYRDTDGSGAEAVIFAALRRKDLRTGAATTVGTTIDTNTGPVVENYGTIGGILANCTSPHIFDFTNFAYYVQINIRRTTAEQMPLFGGARLHSDVIC
jgi:hypothetical protein